MADKLRDEVPHSVPTGGATYGSFSAADRALTSPVGSASLPGPGSDCSALPAPGSDNSSPPAAGSDCSPPPAACSAAAPEPGRSLDNTVVAGQLTRLVRCLFSYRIEPLVLMSTLAGTLLLATSQNLIMDRVCAVNLAFNSSVCTSITNHTFVREESAVQRLANKYVLYKGISALCTSF